MTRRLVILGADGQLGQHLRAALAGHAVTALSRRDCNIGDDRALASALARAEPAIVVNCAAYTRVDDAEADRDTAWRINARAAGVLAALCAERKIRLIHVSTDYVFGGIPPADPVLGYTPADTPAPLNHYGATKLAGEKEIRTALREHWILRTSWLFSGVGRNFARTILRLAAEHAELRVVADQLGTPTFAGHVATACGTLIDAALDGAALAFGTYHVAGTPATSWHGFASCIVDAWCGAAQLARRPAVIPVGTGECPRLARRPADSRLHAADFLDRLRLPPADWRDGLATMIKTPAAA